MGAAEIAIARLIAVGSSAFTKSATLDHARLLYRRELASFLRSFNSAPKFQDVEGKQLLRMVIFLCATYLSMVGEPEMAEAALGGIMSLKAYLRKNKKK